MNDPSRNNDPGGNDPGTAAVIGAGIVGICTALYLQRDGWQVTVIDPEEPGEGASKGNAGIITREHVTPVGMPSTLLRLPSMLVDRKAPLTLRLAYLPTLAPWLARFLLACRPGRVEAIARALTGFLDGVLDDYEPLLKSAGAQDLIRHQGLYQVYRTTRFFHQDATELNLKRRLGIEFETLSGEEVRDRIPALAADIRHGVWFPGCAHTLDPHKLVRLLAEDFARKGGRFVRRKAADFTARQGSVIAVHMGGEEHAAHMVVVCAGAWSKPLARRLGCSIPLDTERGYHVTLPDPGFELPAPVISAEYGFALTSMSMGLRLAGTVELAGLEAPPDPTRNRILEEKARILFPGLKVEGGSDWMGFRPSMPDSMPVIGPVPGYRNAFLAFGHGHLGLTCGAATGRAIADMAAGRAPRFDVTPFRADRFS